MGSHKFTSRKIGSEPSRGPSSNNLRLIPEPKRSKVIEQCHAVCATRHIGQPCVEKGHACYRCQDLAALPGAAPITGTS